MPNKSGMLNLRAILPKENDGFVIVDTSKKAAVSEQFTPKFAVTSDWMVELTSSKEDQHLS